MPTISQAEINRLAFQQGKKPEDISSQLQSKGFTSPATTQEAGITLPGVQSVPTSAPVSPGAPSVNDNITVSQIVVDKIN